mmetsp:Transcript_46601/g.125719  ORF Transcript_46601/g.125719 Transcript_46601/m.125719 type:complete len:288 (-) Transcript_46601:226-1089(-)
MLISLLNSRIWRLCAWPAKAFLSRCLHSLKPTGVGAGACAVRLRSLLLMFGLKVHPTISLESRRWLHSAATASRSLCRAPESAYRRPWAGTGERSGAGRRRPELGWKVQCVASSASFLARSSSFFASAIVWRTRMRSVATLTRLACAAGSAGWPCCCTPRASDAPPGSPGALGECGAPAPWCMRLRYSCWNSARSCLGSNRMSSPQMRLPSGSAPAAASAAASATGSAPLGAVPRSPSLASLLPSSEMAARAPALPLGLLGDLKAAGGRARPAAASIRTPPASSGRP